MRQGLCVCFLTHDGREVHAATPPCVDEAGVQRGEGTCQGDGIAGALT